MINSGVPSKEKFNLTGTAVSSLSGYMSRAGHLLPILDLAVLLAGSLLALQCFSQWAPATVALDARPVIKIALFVVPFTLYDPRFMSHVARHSSGRLWTNLAFRWMLAQLIVVMLAFSANWLDSVTLKWLSVWELLNVVLIGLCRIAVVGWIKRRISTCRDPKEVVSAVDDVFGRGRQSQDFAIRYVCDWLPVAMLAERPIRRWNAVTKAAKDYVLCLVITLLLLPLLAVIAIVIRLDSPGPILFRQRRHGVNNSDFDIYKFRTMRHAVTAPGAAMNQTLRGDARITRVGYWLRRLSFDELPQVFNVLNGQMSLVGPRPHAVDMRTEQRLGIEIVTTYSHRHRVKPGITGLSQISGLRGATDTIDQLRRRVEMDIHYIDHWSLLLDLKILILTVKTVVRGTNAF